MTPDAPWKRDERSVGEFLGTYRTPLSGGNSRQTRSDTLHPTLFIEVKSRSSVPSTWPSTNRLLELIEERAAHEAKRAVLVAHRKNVRNVGDWPAFVRVVDGELAGAVVGIPLSTVRERLEGPRRI